MEHCAGRFAVRARGGLAALAVLWAAAVLAAQAGDADTPEATAGRERIISLSPAITEIVYALGGEDRLVGIALYSDYPPRALQEKPAVGGILNVDTERIFALQPDLIVTPPGAMVTDKIKPLGIEIAFVPNKTLEDIATSFVNIGRLVGKEDDGAAMEDEFRAALAAARKRNAGTKPVSAIVVIGYEPLWVCGGYGFLNELLEAAGGVNVAANANKDFHQVDIESVISAGPEVIIDLTLEDVKAPARRAEVEAFWKRFSSIPAVANGRIEVVESDFLTIPGPRLAKGLLRLERALHGGSGEVQSETKEEPE